VIWPIVTLNDLQADEPRAITDGPFGSNLARQHYTESGPRVVRLQNIGDGRFIDAKAHISQRHFESLRAHEVLGGDLLVASLGEVLPRACLAPEGLGPTIVKADCIRVRLGPNVDPRWAMYALQRPSARKWADEHRHGVGRPRLGLKAIRQIPVPLPDLAEQRRIVEVVEDHLSRLDAAARYLSAVRERSESLAESTLRGQLLKANGVERPLVDLLATPLINGKSVPSLAGGFPVLRLTALKDAGVDLRERKGGDWTKADPKRFLVSRGDYLVARGNGSLRLVGRGSLVRDDPDPVAFPDTAIRIRPDLTRLSPEYLDVVWNSTAIRTQIEAMARTTAGIYKVNQAHVERVVLPVPTLDVQKAIVSSVGATDEQVRRLDLAARIAARRGDVMRRTILAAAFSGKLTGRHTDIEIIEELSHV